MWLLIESKHIDTPLHATVSTNGNLFFKAVDIGRLFKYVNPYQYAKKYSTAVKDIVYPECNLPEKFSKIILMSLDEVCGYFDTMGFPVMSRDFRNMFTHQLFRVQAGDLNLLSINWKYAIKVQLGLESTFTYDVNTFLFTIFKEACRNFYSEFCPKNELVDVHFESLEYYNLDTAPKEVTIFFGNIKCDYVLKA